MRSLIASTSIITILASNLESGGSLLEDGISLLQMRSKKTEGFAIDVVQGDSSVNVLIGRSDDNFKCVTAPEPVNCFADAGNLGHRVNPNEAGDSFRITADDDQVCAMRTDNPDAGWGMPLEVACVPSTLKVLIGSGDANTKCVTASEPVNCANDAGNLGNRANSDQQGDAFQITSDGAQVCATRTDNPSAGWGMQLEVACARAKVKVNIDSSDDNTKCVTALEPVNCAADAGNFGNRANSHDEGDEFQITSEGTQVCTTRTDSPSAGWGMHLQVLCDPSTVKVLIDASETNTKCVTASEPVECADDAGHVGNRVNTHQEGDTFSITADGAQVCVTRTDDTSQGWGMPLKIACIPAPATTATTTAATTTAATTAAATTTADSTTADATMGDEASAVGDPHLRTESGEMRDLCCNEGVCKACE